MKTIRLLDLLAILLEEQPDNIRLRRLLDDARREYEAAKMRHKAYMRKWRKRKER